MNCPKCRGEMIQGWVVDNIHGGRVPSEWAPGAPRDSFWTGTKLPEGEMLPIGAFRCAACGYLEFYARRDFERR